MRLSRDAREPTGLLDLFLQVLFDLILFSFLDRLLDQLFTFWSRHLYLFLLASFDLDILTR